MEITLLKHFYPFSIKKKKKKKKIFCGVVIIYRRDV